MYKSELVKVAGLAPTELQELGGGSQTQPTPILHRAGIVVEAAPVSFRRRFLLLIFTFLSYLSIFYQYTLFLNLKYLFCGSQNMLQSLAWPRYYRRAGTFYQPCAMAIK